MKITKLAPQMAYAINPTQQDVITQQSYKRLCIPIGVAFAMSISLSLSVITSPVRAETTGGENIQHYKNTQDVENTVGMVSQNAKPSSIAKNIEVKTNQEQQVNSAGSVDPEANAKSELIKSSEEKCEHDKNTTSVDQKTVSGEKHVSAAYTDESVAQTPTITNETLNTSQPPHNMSLVEDTKTNNSNSVDQAAEVINKIEPVSKPTDGKGALPTFAQADVNSDHYITKEELKNFPFLLHVFDKVDAGKDGKLEQHEYQSLKMETKREGEIS